MTDWRDSDDAFDAEWTRPLGSDAAINVGSETSAELPHWTEAATGEVPEVLGGNDDDAWAAVPGPRFRVGDSDWAEDDFSTGEVLLDNSAGTGVVEPRGRRRRTAKPSRKERRAERKSVAVGAQSDLAAEIDASPDDGFSSAGYDEFDSDPGTLEGTPMQQEQIEDNPEVVGTSDLGSRFVTAGIVAAVALLAFAIGRITAVLLVTVIVLACAFEVYEALRRAGYHTATVIGLLGCGGIVLMAYNVGDAAFPLVSMLVVVFTFLWYMLEVIRARPTINISLTLMVFAWVGILGAFAGLLLRPDPQGTGLLLGVVACAVGGDIGGYFVGRASGNTPLMPRISPHKTLEGLIGGAITSIVIGGIVGVLLSPWSDKGILAGLALGLVVAITAPIGDLAESLIKRDLGVKDIGTFLPGHGGFLDRFDAILFTLPAGYYLALQIFT